MKRGLVSLFTGLALVMGAGHAFAQNALCQLDGTSYIQEGAIDEDPNPGSGAFSFEGVLSGGTGCDMTVCAAPAAVENASCLANTHGGSYTVCNGECGLLCEGDMGLEPCGDGERAFATAVSCDDPVQSGDFQGVCAGALCVGGDTALPDQASLYVLAFDQATIENALAVCNDPTAPDDSITEATFTGLFGF